MSSSMKVPLNSKYKYKSSVGLKIDSVKLSSELDTYWHTGLGSYPSHLRLEGAKVNLTDSLFGS